MYHIALCDDELPQQQSTLKLISQYFSDDSQDQCEVSSFSSADELLSSYRLGKTYDILLLDVCMPGCSGIDLAHELLSSGIKIPVIFLTTSKDYALEAFGVHAVRYLLKPIVPRELYEAMNFACAHIEKAERSAILVSTGAEQRTLAFREIICCEANKNYTLFSLKSGEKLRVRGTLSENMQRLSDAPEFISAGASFIINLSHVRSLDAKSAAMDNDMSIPIPRRTYAALRKAYMDYFCGER